ncbi:MAG: nucleotidyl transferase AbiEii/AbiGii toxin family protein [Dysgonamonadaceae bacterium]|jgi:hypothetical protein|nr:nucleotidyl transferase AbiEii/AbiGii toxin family protein [Dysgonamonadaceae bacterium]
MIDIASLSAGWIAEKRTKYSKDPNLMESMIYALYLVERLKLSGLDFCFKGGTSLLLLIPSPKRFSIDIDIIVAPEMEKKELEKYLAQVIETSVFTRLEPDEKRSYQGNIPKAHYKFVYQSNFSNKNQQGEIISNPEREILLDILFAPKHYPVLIEKVLETEWLKQDTLPVTLTIPDINSIAGDKLTAFAPNTTGILYGTGKEKEIIKQLFDIGCLFNLLTDIEVFKKSFLTSAEEEIRYRSMQKIESIQHVLQDIINTALLIARKDILKNEGEKNKLKEINTGINQFRHFVFDGKFEILEVQVAAAKAAYLAAIILTDYREDLRVFDSKTPLTHYLIIHPDYNFLNKRLKFIAKGEALFYWSQTIRLLFPVDE